VSALSALAAFRGRGVKITLDGDDLVVVGADLLTDDEVERLRRHKPELVALLRPYGNKWLAEDWRAHFDERAAIAEHDGGLPRPEAERLAFEVCVVEWLNRNHIRSSPDCCYWCGGTERDDVLLPFGVASAGHAWVHSRCWRAWHEARKAEAVADLTAMGIAPAGFSSEFGRDGANGRGDA
jgi:hypothetical protein